MTANLRTILESNGYFNLKEIEGRGVCGLLRFMFTVGLCYGLSENEYNGRYCYSNLSDAKEALDNWDGVGDPKDVLWIKHKGIAGEYSNSVDAN